MPDIKITPDNPIAPLDPKKDRILKSADAMVNLLAVTTGMTEDDVRSTIIFLWEERRRKRLSEERIAKSKTLDASHGWDDTI